MAEATHERTRASGRRWLIVNADDLGLSPGVNAGVARAHDEGIVTSASLMVTMASAKEAVAMAAERPALSLGIHVDLTGEGAPASADLNDVAACRAEIVRQVQRFQDTVQRSPTHVDAHHNVHRIEHLAPLFGEVASELGVPHREGARVRYFPSFYGQWDDGEMHAEWIGPANLMRLIDEHVLPGVTELACHPGIAEPELRSSYRVERAVELETLCDPAVRDHIAASGITLISYRDLPDRRAEELRGAP